MWDKFILPAWEVGAISWRCHLPARSIRTGAHAHGQMAGPKAQQVSSLHLRALLLSCQGPHPVLCRCLRTVREQKGLS